jgi:hypothetical protein
MYERSEFEYMIFIKKKRVYDLPAQYSNQFVVPSQDPCENPSMTKKIKQLSNFRDEKDL